MLSESQHLTFDQLAKGDKWRLLWGFLWRGLLATLASGVGGFIAGASIGFVTALIALMIGTTVDNVILPIRIISGAAGFAIGVFVFWQYIRSLFHARWFGYRLRLVNDAV